MKKVLIFIILFISSINITNAFDSTYEYNIWLLGDLRTSSPGYVGSVILEERSMFFVQYEAFDCEQQNDFYIEIYQGINMVYKLNCTGLHNNLYNLENGLAYLNPGTYDIFYDYNRNDFFQINDILIGVMLDDIIIEPTDNYMFRELNIFENEEELRIFLILQNGFFGLIYFMLFAMGILGYKFNR